MIRGTDAASKTPRRRRPWRSPPWTESSVEWQQLDRQVAPDHPARQIRDAVAREHNFRVTAHRLIITGVCSECRQARQRTRRLELV